MPWNKEIKQNLIEKGIKALKEEMFRSNRMQLLTIRDNVVMVRSEMEPGEFISWVMAILVKGYDEETDEENNLDLTAGNLDFYQDDLDTGYIWVYSLTIKQIER